MLINTTDHFLKSAKGQEADGLLRACVHCGFCNATCPTYQLLGDELDGPRGRIYLIKQLLEGQQVSEKTQLHLDRCLTCHACETTCPSGVKYGRLVDIARELVDEQVDRPIVSQIKRHVLRMLLPYPTRFSFLLTLAQWCKPVLPALLKKQIPDTQKQWVFKNPQTQQRKMLLLEGCVQSAVTPNTNQAAKRVLDKVGIQLITAYEAGCCGAVSQHLSEQEDALIFMRKNIDVWWPYVEQGIEAIVITASGCGAVVKDYGYLLKQDDDYADKAKIISQLAKDVSEVLADELLIKHTLNVEHFNSEFKNISFHSPCTLQHSQQLNGVVESILKYCGFKLNYINDAHLCCGSAGTYSLLQPTLSQQLLDNKLTALQANKPALIVTANIGCQLHLLSQAKVPVKHWVELLEGSLVDDE